VLADLNPPRDTDYAKELRSALSSGRARFVECDVRRPIDAAAMGSSDVVFNLAAIHREPGHQTDEYFETNLHGAENVCAYASAAGAQRMVFTSTIAVYGDTRELTSEDSLSVPDSAYGSSKLIAEHIHRTWQSGADGRQLLIVRPGVVYGAGEGGNVTRLVRSVLRGYFVYMGNRQTHKAGGYVKELCAVIRFAMRHQSETGEDVALLNFTTAPAARVEEFVEAIQLTAGVIRKPFSVPRGVALGMSYLIDAAAQTLRIKQPIAPTRVRKLSLSTNVEAKRLQSLGYLYRFSLREAFEDWKRDVPSDFGARAVTNERSALPAETKTGSMEELSETIVE